MSDRQSRERPQRPNEPPTRVQRECFERLGEFIRAVPVRELRPYNIAPYDAACLILAAAPKFMALWPRMQRLGELDLWLVENCADLAHAYCYASNSYVIYEAGDPLEALQREAVALRGKLRLAFELATLDGGLRGVFVTPLKNTTGYDALNHDLSALTRFFSDHRELLAPRLTLKEEELARAEELALCFSQRAYRRGKRDQAVKDAARLAQQAFTLMVNAYQEVRDAVGFLQRRVGDAHKIAPSLYAGRNSGGRIVLLKGAPDEK